MSETGRKNKIYTEEFKAEAVRFHFEENLSPYRIAKLLEVKK